MLILSRIKSNFYQYFFTGLIICLHQTTYATITNIEQSATKEQLSKMVLIDASNLSSCQRISVKESKCIPANTFQSPQSELASFYHIAWVFGTADLAGNEEVLIFADTKNQRDALIGLFYLAGQKRIGRWNAKKSDLQNILGSGKGQTRSIIRSKYYKAVMRDEYLVLPNELETLKKQDWKLSKENTLKANKTIVFDMKPLNAIARFTKLLLLKSEIQQLKLTLNYPL